MTARVPRLHLVTDDAVVARSTFLEAGTAIAEAAGAAAALQLRCRLDGRAFHALAEAVRDAVRPHGTLLIINDRLDVARAVAADGVHLPEAGLSPARARELLGTDAVLGRSIHSPAAIASEGVLDYVTLGPIWPTPSHPDHPGLGADVLRGTRTPMLAIGGVTPERAAIAREHGAHGVAVIRAVWDAPDPASAVRRFLLSLEPNA